MLKIVCCFLHISMFSSCLAQETDTDCVKKINKVVFKKLQEQSQTDLDGSELKLILAFYSRGRAFKPDSIAVLRSNLKENGFDQVLVLKAIKAMDVSCLSGLYNRDGMKPDYITYRFNPKVID